MKFFLGFICILSAFISKGYSLSCISCSSSTATLCTGSAIICPSGANACTTIYTVTKIASFDQTTFSVERGCGYLSECEQPKSLSNQFMAVDVNTSCCTSDNCTTALLKVSTGNAVPNGFQCPSCFTFTSETCVPTDNFSCTGNETRCTSYSMSTADEPSKPIMAMSGCATPALCSNYSGTTSTKVTGKIKIGIKCGKAQVSTGSQNDITPSSTVSPNDNSESVSITTTVVTSNSHVFTETVANSHSELTRGDNNVTNQASSKFDSQSYHLTTDFANSYMSSNAISKINYTTGATFIPIVLHSTTHEPATSCCVYNGSINLSLNLCLISILILLLMNCLL